MLKRSRDESLPRAQLPGTTARQTSVTQAFDRIAPYEKSSQRHREITDAIAKYLAKDMVPIYTVSKNGFQNLLLTLDKRYQLPSRTYFSQVAIPELYITCRNKVETELRSVEYYATTTDMWSSRTTEPYQSLTVHFINEHFELKSRCLQTSYFPLDHTGENIVNGLKDALANWGLNDEGQVCITTDNASNMIKATEINQWTRLQCFGHRLHLAIAQQHAVQQHPAPSQLCLPEALLSQPHLHLGRCGVPLRLPPPPHPPPPSTGSADLRRAASGLQAFPQGCSLAWT
ncbi:hypothetical protein MHYP_G00225710 [Metynnis hypsauchen]